VKGEISDNLMKNIDRSKARSMGSHDVWENKDETGAKRRGRQERNQYKKHIVYSPSES
jgi:hypothetical protein